MNEHNTAGRDEYDPYLSELRRICGAFPEVTERLSHGSPTFFVRDKKSLCMLHLYEFHGEPGTSIWTPAPPGVQEQLVDDEPERFFRPPYVGHRGWIGVRIDHEVDWSEIDAILRDAYRLVAPKTLIRRLDEPAPDNA